MEKHRYIIPISSENYSKGIELDNYVDHYSQRFSVFGPISRINILVGATNSGKSRFMRGLVKTSNYNILLIDPKISDLHKALCACGRLARANFNLQINVNPKNRDYDPKVHKIKSPWLKQQLTLKIKDSKTYTITKGDFSKTQSWIQADIQRVTSGTVADNQRKNLIELMEKFRFVLSAVESDHADKQWFTLTVNAPLESEKDDIKFVADFIEALCSDNNDVSPIEPLKIYIPVLRTATFLKDISTSNQIDRLAEAIIDIYDLGSNAKVEVFSGNQLYSAIQKDHCSELRLQNRLEDFEQFLGEKFFNDLSVRLMPLNEEYSNGRHLALRVGKDIQRNFHDIGDGIQAIIILMYRLFTAENGSWIFIEEPEQGLHPGLQRIFFDTLCTNKALIEKELTIFITTHSNHMLSIGLTEFSDHVSIFSFQRIANLGEQFAILPIHSKQPSMLSLLGVTNSSVFLANCGIWVEGITDRKYVRAYLNAYLKSQEFTQAEHTFLPQEDIHFAFFEYSGSNLTHYIFETNDETMTEQIHAQFLSNRILLLADQDENKEEKHKRLKSWESDGFKYFVTPGVEVENLISENSLKQALLELISGINTEQIAKIDISFSDYQMKHIGLYLKEKLSDLCPNSFVAPSGTLNTCYKEKLAIIVCSNVNWDNMTDDARELARGVYEFIWKHNQIHSSIVS